MRVDASWRRGVSFDIATASGHQVITDGGQGAGGDDQGARPMELVLCAAAGCCGIDIVTILKRGRHEPTGLRVQVAGTRADAVPAVFTAIDVRCTISGVARKHAERAVQLSVEKYCSVLVMLAARAKITWHVELADSA